jgi:hypothetical protein
MPVSGALSALRVALQEIEDLEAASPTQAGQAPRRPAVTRAVGRAGIVLLSSHFERYIYALNEELVDAINAAAANSSQIPDAVKLVHSKVGFEQIATTGWENRATHLSSFVLSDGWLWQQGANGKLDSDRLLAWMKSPKPKSVVRYFKYWGVNDIFTVVTRSPHRRQDMWLRLDGLVAKRNNIAHGDVSEQATPRDVRGYARAVLDFCERVDRFISRHIAKTLHIPRPW